MGKIGILAYGSLIEEPGDDIEKLIDKRIKTITPFKVEFARKSLTRDNAPTLIPYKKGGKVKAEIFLLKDCVDYETACNLVYQREIGKKKGYIRPENPKPNQVVIETIENFVSIEKVIYTKIGQNIDKVTAKELAKLAIESALGEAGKKDKDGISYLLKAKRNGICTPLTEDYVKEILKILEVESLEEAKKKLSNASR